MKRRHFIKMFGGLGLWASPASHVFASIINDQSPFLESKSRRYFGIQQPGAPARWMFDLFLNPFGDPGLELNPAVANRYAQSQGRFIGTAYEFWNHRGMQLPYLWKFPLPRYGGGQRSMTELLDSLILMQGIHTGNPGHPASQRRHFQSPGATTSLPALAADHQSFPMSAINLNVHTYRFQSRRGLTSVPAFSGGPILEQVLEPFNSRISEDMKQYRQVLKSTISEAKDALNGLATKEGKNLEPLIRDKAAAEALIERGFAGLSETWLRLFAKYSNLIARSIDPSFLMAGLTNRAIGDAIDKRDARYLKDNVKVPNGDLRGLFNANTSCRSMAEGFAMAEYLFTENLTGTVNIGVHPFSGQAAMAFDEHTSGIMPSILINSKYSRALASCLLEFIDRLKAKDMFRGTMIEVAGEFNRCPKVDGSGSDHGFEGKSVAIYSGDITGPHIIGNLKFDHRQTYLGHWGMGDVIPEIGEQLNTAHWAASSARMLGVASPVTSANSVIAEVGGELVPTISRTRIRPRNG